MIIDPSSMYLLGIVLIFFFSLFALGFRAKGYFLLQIINVLSVIFPVYWLYYGIITNNPITLGSSNQLIRGDEYILIFFSYVFLMIALGKLAFYLEKHSKK